MSRSHGAVSGAPLHQEVVDCECAATRFRYSDLKVYFRDNLRLTIHGDYAPATMCQKRYRPESFENPRRVSG